MDQLVNEKEDSIHKEFYKKAIDLYGIEDIRSLYWNSQLSQELRFISLQRVGPLKGSSLLDLGCGKGDFLTYLLNKNNAPTNYLGIDFTSEFIKQAKLVHSNQRFICANFFSIPLIEQYDYIICNGALNFKKPNNLLFLGEFIRFFIKYTKISLGITLLKETGGYITNPQIFSYHSRKVKEYLRSQGFTFSLLEDYADNDMTVIIKP